MALRDRIGEAGSINAMFAVLEREIWRRAVAAQRMPALVRHALGLFSGSDTMPAVGDVVRSTGYSARHFGAVFTHTVGLSPKRFCRVQRLQRTIERLRPAAQVRWARLAIEAGYYDQSHLVREFRDIAGVTPGEYLAGSPDRSNHVALG